MKRSTSHLQVLGISLISVFCSGCSDSADWHVKTYPVKGSITINGSPPLNAILLMHSTAGPLDSRGTTPWATANEKGEFSFCTYRDNDGAPAGDYAITLRWPKALTSPRAIDQLGEKYASPDKPVMMFHVEEKQNTIPAITLNNVQLVKEKIKK